MEWKDHAIVLRLSTHGEGTHIATLLSSTHGIYRGAVREKSRTAQGLYQPGNIIHAHWKARLPEHLGSIHSEMVTPTAAWVMDDRLALLAIQSATYMLQSLLPERESKTAMYDTTCQLFHHSYTIPNWYGHYLLWEKDLLNEIGFGLDLSCCAATGTLEDLCYISPKTGRAVSKEAGRPYHDRLLPLPCFFKTNHGKNIQQSEIDNAMTLLSFFFQKYVDDTHHPHDIFYARSQWITALRHAMVRIKEDV